MVCLMKSLRVLAVFCSVFCVASLGFGQGTGTQSSETVAKPKKNADGTDAPTDNKIPSKYNKKDVPQGVPVFSTDAITVSVDVAVLDNKGHFIPKIPRDHFRVLEDNTPQQVSTFSVGEAPMTIAMVIEFSALYQQYYGEGWYETLVASYGFLQTIRPEDYVAVVAYDLKPEIL